MHHRRLGPRLERLTQVFPVVVLSGARQVGKTTLLRQVLPTWDHVVLDPVADVQGARSEPDLFLANHPGALVIDEVQYAPDLVAAVKRAVDRDRRPGRFVLAGSQQWSVMKGIAESLAGRAVFLDLLGFDLAERCDAADQPSWLATWLESAGTDVPRQRLPLAQGNWELLWRGQLPEAALLPLDVVSDFHTGYRRTYIERDVRTLSDVGDLGQFGRFVRLLGALTAQETNHSHLGRELGVHPATARAWTSLLTASFQWTEVPAWSGNTVKRVSGRPKGYATDTGGVCAGQLLSSPVALGGHPLTGALFETAVVHEVRAQLAALPTPPTLWHWRSHGGAEVDLLLERDGVLFPIEAKLTAHPTKADARGFAALREAYPGQRIAPGLVLAPCADVVRLTPNDWAVPWDATGA